MARDGPCFFYHFGQKEIFCLFTNMGTRKFDQTPNINHINIFHGTVFSLPKMWKTTWISWHTSKKTNMDFPLQSSLLCLYFLSTTEGSTWQFGQPGNIGRGRLGRPAKPKRIMAWKGNKTLGHPRPLGWLGSMVRISGWVITYLYMGYIGVTTQWS